MNLDIDAVKKFIIFNGAKIDKEATIKKFTEKLNLFEAIEDVNKTRIACCIGAVFDNWKSTPIRKDALINFTLKELNVSIETYDNFKSGIEKYLKANTGSKDKELFGIKSGVGFIRWSDWK